MIDYVILGGRLVFEQAAFAQEMLRPRSPLRTLLGVGARGAGAKKFITRADGQVVVDYNFAAAPIALDETYAELFSELKSRLRGRVRGCVHVRVGLYSWQTVRLSLDGDGGELG